MTKTKTGFTKIIVIAMAFITMMFAVAFTAEAAEYWPSTNNIKTYVLSTGNNTTVYKTATSTSKYGTIYASDLITIKAYEGNRLKVSYPVSGGTKTGYIDASAVFKKINGTKVTSTFTAQNRIYAYRRPSGSSTIGYIDPGDKVWVLYNSSGKAHVIYPVSGGYKMGWINVNEIPNSAPSGNGLTSPVPSGCYFNKKTNDNGWYGYHDINRNVSSSTPVYAIADGTVTYYQRYSPDTGTNTLVSYGNFIEFKSNSGGYTAKYCHLSSFQGNPYSVAVWATARKGYGDCRRVYDHCLGTKNVKKGEIIGYIGTTGNSSGTHLHFELRKNGSRIDPVSVFPNLVK